MTTSTVRVVLPAHLRVLGGVQGEVALDVDGPVTQRSVLDALEARHPVLRGTIREHGTLRRRAFVRFFACERDLSHDAAGRSAARRGGGGRRAAAGGGRDGRGLSRTAHRTPDPRPAAFARFCRWSLLASEPSAGHPGRGRKGATG